MGHMAQESSAWSVVLEQSKELAVQFESLGNEAEQASIRENPEQWADLCDLRQFIEQHVEPSCCFRDEDEGSSDMGSDSSGLSLGSNLEADLEDQRFFLEEAETSTCFPDNDEDLQSLIDDLDDFHDDPNDPLDDNNNNSNNNNNNNSKNIINRNSNSEEDEEERALNLLLGLTSASALEEDLEGDEEGEELDLEACRRAQELAIEAWVQWQRAHFGTPQHTHSTVKSCASHFMA